MTRLLLPSPLRVTSTVRHLSTTPRFPPVETARQEQHGLHQPVLFKQRCNLPAVAKWFTPPTHSGARELNTAYLGHYSSTTVPLELTRFDAAGKRAAFERFEAPLSLLLAHMSSSDPSLTLYLAQCSLADLPSELYADVRLPSLVNGLGKGDIYGSSLWMGRPPTRTPLHRDPNPNLFVQLAGQKTIRLMAPEHGRRLYQRSRVGQGHANLRGGEMMVGQEMERLENAVWGEESEENKSVCGVEATLQSGDALLIPLGWWHAVRGVGEGANASVNWWFR
ncbi:Clavaminate synthase-like protein [Massarina eburnea CBS 473.64]|uniref:Clavaminate synthase-like protein n=1 Tax=Massarina eburnea CBS 473.64 TaxID=1395130 RepID=A0A6A6RTP1_9PLEO|nr:Clavaminate synthase-like protein [Massarina eburnea CBS 473.64]